MRLITSILIVSLLISTQALAWNQVGHQVVAQIAYDNLTASKKQQVDQLTKIISAYYPEERNFMDSSTWPDKIKYQQDVSAFNTWHYINMPIDKNGKNRRYYARENVVWAIGQAEQVLASDNANDFQKSLFLRFLVHFVGDVHQPLHAASLYSKRFPKGDQGGNLFLISYQSKPTNLHSVWDQCFTYTNQTYSNDAAIKKLATELEAKYPQASFGAAISSTNPQQWANESYQISKDIVYQAKYKKNLSESYVTEGQAICQKRLVLAGYRLANILNTTKLSK